MNRSITIPFRYKPWHEGRLKGRKKWWWVQLCIIRDPPRWKNALLLALNNNLPTWDNNIKRGWCGPSHYSVCILGACRLNVVVYINQKHYMFIRYNFRASINNIVEFIALWTLLEMTIKKEILNIYVGQKNLKDNDIKSVGYVCVSVPQIRQLHLMILL